MHPGPTADANVPGCPNPKTEWHEKRTDIPPTRRRVAGADRGRSPGRGRHACPLHPRNRARPGVPGAVDRHGQPAFHQPDPPDGVAIVRRSDPGALQAGPGISGSPLRRPLREGRQPAQGVLVAVHLDPPRVGAERPGHRHRPALVAAQPGDRHGTAGPATGAGRRRHLARSGASVGVAGHPGVDRLRQLVGLGLRLVLPDPSRDPRRPTGTST